MQQEVLEKRELEFVPREKPKLKCSDCNKEFSHIEKCKDGKNRCKNCKKKIPTNIFYNPNWNRKEYVGVKNLSHQEKNLLIKKYVDKGFNYLEAKRKVEYNLNVIKGQKINKVLPECSNQNLEIKKKDRTMTDELIKGLGIKK